MTNPTKMGDEGLTLLKQFEGLVLYAYDDADASNPKQPIGPGDKIKGVLTIGYGHTGPDIVPGMKITEARAETILRNDLGRFEKIVSSSVKQKILQNQFDSLVVFAYNIGGGAFERSSVLRRLNAGDDHGAAEAFLMWNKQTIDGKLVEVPGLTRRRKAERELFLRR